MRNDGNVLIATDTAGRMLELAQLLDQMWRNTESGLTTYSLALLNNVSFNVVEFAKSQVEWMSDKIMRAFEDNRNNPFQFKHLKLCHNLAELARVPEPKVVLASTPDLQSGYSRDLFVAWCGNSKNSIILTSRTSPGTLTRWLIENQEAKTVTLEIRRRIKLDGAELEEYVKRKQDQEQEDIRRKVELALKGDVDSSDESETEMEVDSFYTSGVKGKHDLMRKAENKSRTGFFKQAKKAYPMFLFQEEKLKWDEYGEVIRPEDYIIADPVPADEEKSKEVWSPLTCFCLFTSREVPTKCVSSTVTLDINANVLYIDFEGRSDGDSIRRYLTQIKPRQLVLIHGPEEATSSLADYCHTANAVQGRVFCPSVGDVIDATTERHIYQVRLRDQLASSLNFAKARDIELAWIDGQIDMSAGRTDTSAMSEGKGQESMDTKDNKEEEEEPVAELVPTLYPLPPSQVQPHTAVFVNEPKLSDFKLVLINAGIPCEFVAGVLICNNVVAVRRESGRIQVEGTLCPDYFKVRELLYEQYAIV
ncbi:hypothetical protein C0Q70_13242 [Pomacea canaliculata]|uniref:Cleavage and polyadenylation specificity factor subunit 2 n=1 Tax=Pomacea canaliculata TaxID=400727 RepID=A0A2T7NWN8_POMCA|nr:hypothetical protein C0Q70_13242 [Pomacea canaliculata]